MLIPRAEHTLGEGGGGVHGCAGVGVMQVSLHKCTSYVVQSHKTGRSQTVDRMSQSCCISAVVVGPRAPTNTLSLNCAWELHVHGVRDHTLARCLCDFYVHVREVKKSGRRAFGRLLRAFCCHGIFFRSIHQISIDGSTPTTLQIL